MASPRPAASAAQFANAHRTLQNRNAAATALLVRTLYLRRLAANPNDTGAFTSWLDEVVPQIIAARRKASVLANAYYGETRAIQATRPDLPDFTPKLIDTIETQQLRTSLIVTGKVHYRQRLTTLAHVETTATNAHGLVVSKAGQKLALAKAREATIADLMSDLSKQAQDRIQATALSSSATTIAGATVRHVANGGREQIQANVKADPIALGYVRRTRPGACYFCLMLASRGPVYEKESFDESDARFVGQGDVKVHDSCGCGFDPVFSRNSDLLDQSSELEQQWIRAQNTRKAGVDPVNAFRQLVEGR